MKLTTLDWIINGPWWICANPSAPNLIANLVIHASDVQITVGTNGCEPQLQSIRWEDWHYFYKSNDGRSWYPIKYDESDKRKTLHVTCLEPFEMIEL